MILDKNNNAIEYEVFHRTRPNFTALLAYGFTQSETDKTRVFAFSKDILQGDFRVDLTIKVRINNIKVSKKTDKTIKPYKSNDTIDINLSNEINIRSQVIDLLTEDEYINVRIASVQGEFVNSVREAYHSVLQDIAKNCFIETRFANPQTNRLAEWLLAAFDEQPDEPFAKHKETGVYRNPSNQKWYALITQVTIRTIEPEHPDYQNDSPAGKQKVEIINIKVDSNSIAELHKIDGIYPAYHMNKKHWITITLDDRLNDEALFDLVQKSRKFTLNKSKPRSKKSQKIRTEPKHWIIPANPSYYDVIKVFSEKDVIYWYQGANFIVGDIVYMYLGKPYSAIFYKCEVIETDIPTEKLDKKGKAIKRMNLQRVQTYDKHQFPLSRLKQLGLTSIRGARGVPDAVVQAIG